MSGSAYSWPADTVKSITLADMSPAQAPVRRPSAAVAPCFARIIHLTKVGLMAWGTISLGAVVGMAATHFGGSSDAPLLAAATTRPASATAAGADSPGVRLAALIDVPLPPTMTSPPFSRTPGAVSSALPRGTATVASVAPMAAPAASAPAPLLEARLPRPRPDEPIITGSIAPAAPERAWAPRPRRATLDPCTALKNLGAPYLLGDRCGPYTRVYPAPPRAFDRVTVYPPPPARSYAPRPYQPPVVYQD